MPVIKIKPSEKSKKEKKTPSVIGVIQGRTKKAKKPKGRRGDMPPNQGKETKDFMGLAQAGVPLHSDIDGTLQPETVIIKKKNRRWARSGWHRSTTFMQCPKI